MARRTLEPDFKAAFPQAAGKPLMVFDGTCVFCTAGARFAHRFDRRGAIAFAHAQAPLGVALYRHFGWDGRDYETNILIMDGKVYSKWATLGGLGRAMGGAWRLLSIVDAVPEAIGDRLYDLVARNRYRIFGRTETCAVPDARMRARMLDSAER